jgi:hypothetical protein
MKLKEVELSINKAGMLCRHVGKQAVQRKDIIAGEKNTAV